jgi:hypothetical protein
MRALEKELKKEGYLVVNNGYPSRKHGIKDLTVLWVTGSLSAKNMAPAIFILLHILSAAYW